jgi:FGGY-family pentulose kinase
MSAEAGASGSRAFLGIDVGTASVRAGVFDSTGRMLGVGVEPIQIFRPQADFVEQSSDDIWRAAGAATRGALKDASLPPRHVVGIGFDATCSLVALDQADQPVTVSPTGNDAHNVIVWMDHRAMAEAAFINQTRHDVLRYVGGTISPEMETPKLLWLQRHLPATWSRAARFLDLPDFLTYRATGIDVRSLCTTVCKWTYLGHENGGRGAWSESYFKQIGLEDLLANDARKIGCVVRPMGERAGPLREAAAKELGLEPGTAVGVAIIDAHAGGLGLIGASTGSAPPTPADLEQRLALIGGTSSCHMAVSRAPRYVPGVWGPYFSAMVPGMWLTEGGQSATGALIDSTIDGHAEGARLRAAAQDAGTSVYALLNGRLDALAAQAGGALRELTRELHVLPDHHGNRSPRADATLRGMVSGLKLSHDGDALAVLYLATLQAIAHGTRHIIDALNANGYAINTVLATGGGTKNPVFLRVHADVTGCRIVLPAAREAVLLGAAILGSVACGDHSSVVAAMAAMSRAGETVLPDAAARPYCDAKHRVFLRMFDDQMAYRALMSEGIAEGQARLARSLT